MPPSPPTPLPKGEGRACGALVRGVTLDLFPGQETTSLLISPEGWLVGLMEIEAGREGGTHGAAPVLGENAVWARRGARGPG